MNSTLRSTAETMNVTMTSITEQLVSASKESVKETLKVMCYAWLTPLLLLGSLGNIVTILVMQRTKDRNIPSSPQIMLQALAVADILVLWIGGVHMWLVNCVDVHIHNIHTAVCKLLMWLIYSLTTVAAWMVTAVTIQRTIAVRLPHGMKVLCSPRRTGIAIAVIFITPFCVQGHWLVGVDVAEGWCRHTSPEYTNFVFDIWTWVMMVINSLLPFLCQFVCVVLLGRALLRASNTTSAPHTGRRQMALRTTVMVLLLSTTFLLLTLPFCGVVIWLTRRQEHMTRDTRATLVIAQGVTSLLWFTNSAVNFLLYCATGGRFRREFVNLLQSVWTRVKICPCSQQ